MRTRPLRFRPIVALGGLLAVSGCDTAKPVSAPEVPTAALAVNGALRGTMLISAGFDDYLGEIYTMQPDGSGLTRLTDAPGALDDGPKWSPDGRKIAFHSDRAGSLDIYIMNAEGSDLVQLTSGPATDTYPVWSPDGRRIAFTRNDPDPSIAADVYVINVDGTGLTQLTNDAANEHSPIWSPNGQQLLYAKGRARPDIWIMNADGTGQAPLLATPRAEWATDWAADGRILLAQRVPDPETINYEIFVMNDDGTGLTQLTDRPWWDLNAVWSWDMRYIVFGHTGGPDEGYNSDIWVMNADGSGQTPITTAPDTWEWNSDWRPF